MNEGTARRITDEERERESTVSPRWYHWQMVPMPVEMTPAEALDILYQAATRDPYHGDAAHLVECRMVLERALGLEEG